MPEENEPNTPEEVGVDDIIVLTDEEGNDGQFVFLTILQHDDADYALLAPLTQMQDETDDQLDVYIFGYTVNEEGEEFFDPVGDEELIEAIGVAAEQFFAEVTADEDA